MSLTSPFGRAPFGPAGGEFDFAPPERVRYWEPWPRRMRALLSGETVLDSRRGVLLWETGNFPAFYYPIEDVREDLLAEEHIAASPRGPDDEELLPGYIKIEQHAMDRWFEEDDAVYAHPRDPYHRVDVRSSSRRVAVRAGGEVVAESGRPKLVFETGNPIRYYLPFVDVRTDSLTESETVSQCPYKGDGQHWHLAAGGERIEDAAWSLPHPLPEGIPAAQHICFYPDKVDIAVDGVRVPGDFD